MIERDRRRDRWNDYGPNVFIEEGASIGRGNYFGPNTFISRFVKIGNNNRFEGFCSIGTPPEHKGVHLASEHMVHIGNNCFIKEFTTINRGAEGNTIVGDDVWMLRGSHIGHDAIIMENANISCDVLVGGHSVIMRGANLGLAAVVHQKRVVGAYAMVGMNATVTHDVQPFHLVHGSPARFHRVNEIGMERSGFFDAEDIKQAKEFAHNYKLLLPATGKIYHNYEEFCKMVRFVNREDRESFDVHN